MTYKLFELYKEAVKIHIWTKTKDYTFHKFMEEVYETLFTTFHTIAEKKEDIDRWDYTVLDEDKSEQRVYDLLKEVKKELEGEKDKYSTWYDNLIRWEIDKLEFLCGSAKSFIEEEMEDEMNMEDKKTENSKKDNMWEHKEMKMVMPKIVRKLWLKPNKKSYL